MIYLEGIMSSEINQKRTNNIQFHLYVNLKNETNEQIKKQREKKTKTDFFKQTYI